MYIYSRARGHKKGETFQNTKESCPASVESSRMEKERVAEFFYGSLSRKVVII
jgi:hypothetical protein